jgi:hypothetical protein
MPGSLKTMVLALATFASVARPGQQRIAPEACLPDGIKPSDVVSTIRVKKDGSDKIEKTIVQDKLRALGARCQDGKPVDSTGKEICFYKLTGCWGNPPSNYRDILRRQSEELSRLREHCTVVEMTCNPSGRPPE